MKHIVQAYSRLQMREIMSTLSYFQAHASGIHTFNNMEGPSKWPRPATIYNKTPISIKLESVIICEYPWM